MNKRLGSAAAKRNVLKADRLKAGELAAAKCIAAAQRRAAALKTNGATPTERRAANIARRMALDTIIAARAKALKARCDKAAAECAVLLARRVETARKKMAAPHPKREVT